LSVKEGDQVRAGYEIARIDDKQAQMQKKISYYGWLAAAKRSQDDVEIRYSKVAADTAQADLDDLKESNQLHDKAITATDIRQAELTRDKGVLQIERAEQDKIIAGYDANTKKAEYEASEVAIERRIVRAPFDGEVISIDRKQDEWVSPGDSILRLARLDTMNIEGDIDASLYDPHEIKGCPVTVEVELARGRKELLDGRIVYVSSVVGGHGEYAVRAEVTNRKEYGHWVLRHGLKAKMTIHLNGPKAETALGARVSGFTEE
jgi:multidrug efflux pump subunit AcrA (membrane-fusion protein)